ncbi:hypothetical protein [Sphingomonas sp.]|uniref:hypothetical protein n=1 Tax=Sphingomonas sp. TaxID=28214 RepID=UPI003CC5D8D9
MFELLRRPWFEARSLSVLQTYYEQTLKLPLPELERKLLRGAVNVTLKAGGTPFDAATRFYTAFAETHLGRGGDLHDIKFGTALGRMWALRDNMKFWGEHMAAMKQVSALRGDRTQA